MKACFLVMDCHDRAIRLIQPLNPSINQNSKLPKEKQEQIIPVKDIKSSHPDGKRMSLIVSQCATFHFVVNYIRCFSWNLS